MGIDLLKGKIKFLLSKYGENETCKIPTSIIKTVINYLIENGKGDSVVEHIVRKNGKEEKYAFFNIEDKIIMAKIGKANTELSNYKKDKLLGEVPEKPMSIDDLDLGTNLNEEYTLRDFLRDTNKRRINSKLDRYALYAFRPDLYCKDGYRMSIQASMFHLCEPRENRLEDYTSFEVTGLADHLSELEPYEQEQRHDRLIFRNENRVYGYVPRELVEKIIAEHGGIDKEKTLSYSDLNILVRNNKRLSSITEQLDDMNKTADQILEKDEREHEL